LDSDKYKDAKISSVAIISVNLGGLALALNLALYLYLYLTRVRLIKSRIKSFGNP